MVPTTSRPHRLSSRRDHGTTDIPSLRSITTILPPGASMTSRTRPRTGCPGATDRRRHLCQGPRRSFLSDTLQFPLTQARKGRGAHLEATIGAEPCKILRHQPLLPLGDSPVELGPKIANGRC